MRYNVTKTAIWIDPITIAANLEKDYEYFVFLYSNIDARYSYIGFDLAYEIKGDSFEQLIKQSKNKDDYLFGYIGYETKDYMKEFRAGNLLSDQYHITGLESFINFPNYCFLAFNQILCFDHLEKTIINYSLNSPIELTKFSSPIDEPQTNQFVDNLSSNMTKEEYLDKVIAIKQLIRDGEVYQANLTRKFFGNIGNYHGFSLFRSLNKLSPSNYSAFFKLGDQYIISSSPELFITINEQGLTSAKPIKGSIKRSETSEKDIKLKKFLKNSPKNIAENLMITDLMRNDFNKSCKTGTVQVPELFKLESFTTIHHLHSHIIGEKKDSVSNLEFIKHAFPPGSMTGAPKVAAVNLCDYLEGYKRGIYSGALGYFKGPNEANFSVVIRTLLIDKDKFEFQVGGGIVYDSTPEDEYNETLTKAKAITKLLNIKLT